VTRLSFESRADVRWDAASAGVGALQVCVREVHGRVPVLLTAGFYRRGCGSLQSGALGAHAVLLGGCICGTAVAGEEGVREGLLNLVADRDLTLRTRGSTSCRELDAPRCAGWTWRAPAADYSMALGR